MGAEERKAAIREGGRVGAAITNGVTSTEVRPDLEEQRQRRGAYIAARGVGISEATYARANALVSAAEDPEDPAHDTAVHQETARTSTRKFGPLLRAYCAVTLIQRVYAGHDVGLTGFEPATT
ncbi:MAG: hypothetical protein QM658_05570 [Gordonia sp. (in: high G+C Gram-positive bacteria)]